MQVVDCIQELESENIETFRASGQVHFQELPRKTRDQLGIGVFVIRLRGILVIYMRILPLP